ncbi:response regulator transcription factor [bacterium]|nr:MAG: response regulator transcription factor [bacterium]
MVGPISPTAPRGDAAKARPGAGGKVIDIFLVEDHQLVAEALTMLIDAEGDMHVIARVGSVADAAALAPKIQPDLLLVDFRLPDGTGADVARLVRKQHQRVVVVFLSVVSSPAMLFAAVRAGARGYLLKTQSAAETVSALRRAAGGEMLIPSATLAQLVADQGEFGHLMVKLTPRERELLRLTAEGLDNRTLAERMGIGYATLRGHMRNLIGKLDAHSKLEAVVKATELGLIDR